MVMQCGLCPRVSGVLTKTLTLFELFGIRVANRPTLHPRSYSLGVFTL